MMVLSDTKRKKIEEYLNEGLAQDKIVRLCKCGKSTVVKVAKALRERVNSSSNLSTITDPSQVTLGDVDSYTKKCLMNPSIQYNSGLINTAIKLLELKNKIEPEALKKMREEEQSDFVETIGDAIDYIHTIRPDYEIEVPVRSDGDDKTREAEG